MINWKFHWMFILCWVEFFFQQQDMMDSSFTGQHAISFGNNSVVYIIIAKTLKEKGDMHFISNAQLHLLHFKFMNGQCLNMKKR